MICPYCHHTEDKVVDSRSSGLSIRRRRECLACGRRFTTYEYVEVVPLTVTKRDGRHEPFKREKLISGIDAACKKRPVSRRLIEEIVTRVENALMTSESQEVRYDEIGNLVIASVPASDSTMAMTIAKRGRSTNTRENTLILSIDSRMDNFMSSSRFLRCVYLSTPPALAVASTTRTLQPG